MAKLKGLERKKLTEPRPRFRPAGPAERDLSRRVPGGSADRGSRCEARWMAKLKELERGN